jgi:hypothetical protein
MLQTLRHPYAHVGGSDLWKNACGGLLPNTAACYARDSINDCFEVVVAMMMLWRLNTPTDIS